MIIFILVMQYYFLGMCMCTSQLSLYLKAYITFSFLKNKNKKLRPLLLFFWCFMSDSYLHINVIAFHFCAKQHLRYVKALLSDFNTYNVWFIITAFSLMKSCTKFTGKVNQYLWCYYILHTTKTLLQQKLFGSWTRSVEFSDQSMENLK